MDYQRDATIAKIKSEDAEMAKKYKSDKKSGGWFS